ncbi:DUF3810 domain-containing protein [bacterium]|nr:DUF3810 domain-containing protein [bacterium]
MSDPGPREQQAAGDPSEGRRPPLNPRSTVRWLVALAPWSAALLLAAVARATPGAVEGLYSRGLYPLVASGVGQLGRGWAVLTGSTLRSGRFLSLSEAGLIAVAVGGGLALHRAWIRGGAAAVARLSLAVSGSGALAFLLLWGLNYSRLPLAVSLDLEPTGASVEELDQVAEILEAQLLVDLVGLDFAGLSKEPAEAVQVAQDAWREAGERTPALGPDAGVVVRPVLSGVIVSAGISGVFSPFTQEAHVAGHLPRPDLLFTACHELAHARGWAREDEANYLAWRVGSRASNHQLRAAARLLALGHVLGALGRADRAVLVARLDGLDPRIQSALEDRARFWDRERSPAASRAASAVNDAYLRSQGQDGVASYGRMVDLLVAEWRAADERLPAGDPR